MAIQYHEADVSQPNGVELPKGNFLPVQIFCELFTICEYSIQAHAVVATKEEEFLLDVK